MRLTRMRQLSAIGASAAAVVGALITLPMGCGTMFDPGDKLQTLRVLAVRKDKPYAKPGEKVSLEILYWDGKAPVDKPRTIQVTWIGGCADPDGDLYYGCYPQLGQIVTKLRSGGTDADQAAALVGLGTTFSVTIPTDIISRRPPVNQPGNVPYGLSYVFFSACAGHLGPGNTDDPNGSPLPIACYDDQNHALGPADFVPGYSAIYSYEDRVNTNPILNDVVFNSTNGQSPDPHVPRCTENDRTKCTKYALKPDIDRTSAETDPGATDANGKALLEQLWVDFYATAGDLDSGSRLVNDAEAGWNDDNGTQWRAPADPGPVILWSVVHDNRGGVAWKQRRVIVD